MSTIQIDLIEVKERPNTNNIIITARYGNKVIVREIDRNKFDTWETFANWIITQKPDFILLPEKEQSLSIDFHTETEIDPESGDEFEVRVLDNVVIL